MFYLKSYLLKLIHESRFLIELYFDLVQFVCVLVDKVKVKTFIAELSGVYFCGVDKDQFLMQTLHASSDEDQLLVRTLHFI